MNVKEFIANVDTHDGMVGVEITAAGFKVRDVATNYTTSLPFSVVASNDWENLRDVILGRDPMPIIHLARIVGYYSRVENWNTSKVGELKDRHRGDYQI